MARLLPLLLLVAFLAFASASSNVVDLTEDNFASVLDGSKPVFIEFYAPWCGHCKTLAPVYEVFANAFAHAKDKVVIAKVDAEANRPLAMRFEIKGFPTLKFFPTGNPEESEKYEGGRSEDDLVGFIEKKTGVKAKRAPLPPSSVVILTGSNFAAEITEDATTDALVEFYAPWCGHCKKLTPEYEKLAAVYRNEPGVKIAKIDCDAHAGVCKDFGVQGYPTLKWFSKTDKSEPQAYEGGRDVDSFVSFINEKTGLERQTNGRPGPNAGRVEELDALVAGYATVSDKAALLKKAKETAAALTGAAAKSAKLYLRALELLQTKADYLQTETERLSRMLESGSLSAAKADEFAIRLNVLKAFE
jgi:protein disulfide-isomerase A6